MEKDSERSQKIVPICNSFEQSFLSGMNSWEELSEYAQDTFKEAEKCLKQKHFKLFGLYLKHYSDIWKFAYANLGTKEYKLFCIEQSEAYGNHVM